MTDGASLNDYVQSHLVDGSTLIVCPGTYTITGDTFEANDWALVAPEGATLLPQGQAKLFVRGSRFRMAGFVFDETAADARGWFRYCGYADDQVQHSRWRHGFGPRLRR